jgi:hypothetical protein
MPFLFVDYDQGAGGEKFCAGLSESTECEKLSFKKYQNGRTKVQDVFAQEFLKEKPNIKIKQSHPDLYTIVPTHRHTDLARSLLENVQSIRIGLPQDPKLYQHMIEQRINKVLLTREPDPGYFFGLLKDLSPIDRDFFKKIKYNMLTVEIILLSQSIDPTPSAVEQYIDQVRTTRYQESDQPYDLVIPYEQLVYDTDQVKIALSQNFGITVVGDWLENYA